LCDFGGIFVLPFTRLSLIALVFKPSKLLQS
jgi:hypothetical protein